MTTALLLAIIVAGRSVVVDENGIHTVCLRVTNINPGAIALNFRAVDGSRSGGFNITPGTTETCVTGMWAYPQMDSPLMEVRECLPAPLDSPSKYAECESHPFVREDLCCKPFAPGECPGDLLAKCPTE